MWKLKVEKKRRSKKKRKKRKKFEKVRIILIYCMSANLGQTRLNTLKNIKRRENKTLNREKS